MFIFESDLVKWGENFSNLA